MAGVHQHAKLIRVELCLKHRVLSHSANHILQLRRIVLQELLHHHRVKLLVITIILIAILIAVFVIHDLIPVFIELRLLELLNITCISLLILNCWIIDLLFLDFGLLSLTLFLKHLHCIVICVRFLLLFWQIN